MILGFWILLTNLGSSLQITLCIIAVSQRKALEHSSVVQQLLALRLSYTAGRRQFKQLVCITLYNSYRVELLVSGYPYNQTKFPIKYNEHFRSYVQDVISYCVCTMIHLTGTTCVFHFYSKACRTIIYCILKGSMVECQSIPSIDP